MMMFFALLIVSVAAQQYARIPNVAPAAGAYGSYFESNDIAPIWTEGSQDSWASLIEANRDFTPTRHYGNRYNYRRNYYQPTTTGYGQARHSTFFPGATISGLPPPGAQLSTSVDPWAAITEKTFGVQTKQIQH